MNLIKDKYPNIKAIFAGTGPLEEDIKNEIVANRLEDKIKLLGWRDDVKELINSSDVVGLFSKREGLGKCLLEAMICGKYVIATNSRGSRELIEDKANGFLVKFGDIDFTANSIEQIYIKSKNTSPLNNKITTKVDKYLLHNILSQLDSYYEMI